MHPASHSGLCRARGGHGGPQHLRSRLRTRPASASMFPAVHTGLVTRTSGNLSKVFQRSLAFSPHSLLLLPGLCSTSPDPSLHIPYPQGTLSPRSPPAPPFPPRSNWMGVRYRILLSWRLAWVSRGKAWEVWRSEEGAGLIPRRSGQACCPWSLVGKARRKQ